MAGMMRITQRMEATPLKRFAYEYRQPIAGGTMVVRQEIRSASFRLAVNRILRRHPEAEMVSFRLVEEGKKP